MREYTKHRVWRIRDLNEKYFEVLISKDSLNFVPGSTARIYTLENRDLFIASGIQEAWVRLIIDRKKFPNFNFELNNIKLCLELNNPVPSLAGDESPNFVLDSSSIGAFFSYVSTFPNVKCKVCYVGGDMISEDWIKSNHTLVDLDEIKKASNVYVLGNREVITAEASGVLEICKESYVY